MSCLIRVQTEDFDIENLHKSLNQHSSSGAVVTFTGLVREKNKDGLALEALCLEHYPGMTEKALKAILDAALSRWDLSCVTLIHRIGVIHLNQQIVFVGVASPHRAEAFEAACFIMDRLKTDAPFWKKEIYQNGKSEWVAFKDSDQIASDKWL